MIALSGIFIGIGIGLIVVWQVLARPTMPTEQEMDDLVNQWHRKHIERLNQQEKP